VSLYASGWITFPSLILEREEMTVKRVENATIAQDKMGCLLAVMDVKKR
jgi:hypothetical protein